MADRPTKGELLEAVRRFIADELMPELDGVRRFHARVAANALGIVAREIELEGTQLPARYRRLVELLERDPAPPAELPALSAEVEALEQELAASIRRGEADHGPRREAVLRHLRETVRERLAIANPDYR